MGVQRDESLSKDETVLICVHCISRKCEHEHISPLLGEHLCWAPWLFTIERYICVANT